MRTDVHSYYDCLLDWAEGLTQTPVAQEAGVPKYSANL